MAELILHHFEASPFSEKVRLLLGFKGLAWKSVIVPAMLPKPDVVALTGGYRKTPFLQIGADIYCDTALIAEVLESIQPEPALFPAAGAGLARTLAEWADNKLFWAAIRFNRLSKGPSPTPGGFDPTLLKALYEDRKAMGFDIEWVRPADGASAFRTYLLRLSEMLVGQPHLLGASPCIADFAAFHSLWYLYARPGATKDIADLHAPLLDWLSRMGAIGHGRPQEFTSGEAIDIAARSEPLLIERGYLKADSFIDDHGVALGSRVAVSAEMFGLEPTEGQLIAATRTHFSLRRVDTRAGTVHVHFPRIGYVLKT